MTDASSLALWQSLPLVCILLPLGSAAVTSVLPKRTARCWTAIVLSLQFLASILLTLFLRDPSRSYTFPMGHFPAPWGNELRIGMVECLICLFFSLVMLLSFLGGMRRLDQDIVEDKQSLYCVMILLMSAALSAQVFTNDLFTSYVFVEIMTLSSSALIASRARGRTVLASARYMIMNMLGSSLFLLGLVFLYDLTGHLLMGHIREAVDVLVSSGENHLALIVTVALMTVGLSIKSALFPFHTWVPDAYGSSTPASSAILSSLVSKGYIFVLLKIICRCMGPSLFRLSGMDDILFVFALLGMILGSVSAVRQRDVRRMIAYSSVAQIGYVYLGIGLGSEYGLMAALFHIICHAACKSMLFLSASGLIEASGGKTSLHALRGSGHRAPLTGIAFVVGALSMIGFPFLGGFVSKVNFALAAMDFHRFHRYLVLLGLVISTWLNTWYFLRVVILIYTKPEEEVQEKSIHRGVLYTFALVALIALNFYLGIGAQRLITAFFDALPAFSAAFPG
ncbi:MAG: sodium:proton antiporter [Clostridia bacterium]|nr:sodium:proton antiporter [Clostridia bacterium]